MKPKNKAQTKAESAAGQELNTGTDPAQKPPEPQPSVEIAFEDIDVDAGTLSRPVQEEVAEEYAELMKGGTAFPSVDVYEEGGRYFLADGFHRLIAALKAGKQTITANVHQGGRLDALKAALGANETHGLRRSIEDKRFAVGKALTEFSDLSDRAIAELCHVSPTSVGERRKLLPPTVHVDSSPDAEPEKRRGRDGKTRRKPSAAAKDNDVSDDARSVENTEPVGSSVMPSSADAPGDSQEAHANCEMAEPKTPTRWDKRTLVIVVWDDDAGDDEPTIFYSRSAYPNCILFHIWRRGETHLERSAMCGYNQLLTMLTDDEHSNTTSAVRVRYTARFVSATYIGVIPPSAILFDAVLRFADLLDQVEKAWPTARKVLFRIPARSGWEVYVRRKDK